MSDHVNEQTLFSIALAAAEQGCGMPWYDLRGMTLRVEHTFSKNYARSSRTQISRI